MTLTLLNQQAARLVRLVRSSIDSGQVCVVTSQLESELVSSWCEGILSVDEIARRDRYRVSVVANEFAACRLRLRLLLAGLLDRTPSSVELVTGVSGKPYLRDSGSNGLQFSVSHSRGFAAYAFARNVPIGVDLESLAQSLDEKSLARELLSSTERESWSELPEAKRRSAILRTWVIKESLFKALGIGIAGNLPRIECLTQCDREIQDIEVDDAFYSLAASDAYWPLQDEQRANSWRVRSFKLAVDYNLAVAYESSIESVQLVSWDEATNRYS